MADRLNITRGYLSTYFKEKSGTNFVDYVMTYRMDKAKEILSRTDLKIQEVGQLVGYANVSTFIRVFKKQTGTTPGDYKKLNAG
nr:helix-turn-helix transcriptional regulator [Cohnella hashimotonis]